MLISYYTVYHVEINGKGSVGCLSSFRDDNGIIPGGEA